MMIETYEHIREFEGLEVVDYQPDVGLVGPCPRMFQLWTDPYTEPVAPTTTRKVAAVAVLALTILGALVWSWLALLVALLVIPVLLAPQRERLDVDEVSDQWERFLAEPKLDHVQALVIGPWFSEIDEGPWELIEQLAENAAKFPNLRAIYFGDIVSEECELSWIEQGNQTLLLHAFPQLEVLVVRGANSLRFENLRHDNLRKLIVQSGGLSTQTIHDLCAADLPSLEHLELWLGEENYGFDASVEDLRSLWDPKTFPKLKSLGLRNSVITDEIVDALVVDDRAVARLERLDLSLGTLSDLGAEALFNSHAVLQLEELDLHHHYVSPDWAEKLASLPIAVDLSERLEEDGEYRYIAIGE